MSLSIGRSTVRGYQTGVVAVGTSPVQLAVDSSLEAKKGVLLLVLSDDKMGTSNTYDGIIYIGGSATVGGDPLGDPENFGMPLGPNETFTIPIDSLNELWVIASKPDQLLAWAVV